MENNLLGNTSLLVSKLCFGSLTMGPLQANKSPEEGGRLLLHGFEKGINFIDTAELYETYPHIQNALNQWDREKIIIATKSYAYSRETAEASLHKALKEMNIDYIDIFLLHEQESQYTLKGHWEAFTYFMKMKEKGYIKALGISTHTIAAVAASLEIKEIEVLHPIVNMAGLGIQDGSIEEMVHLLEKAKKMGKGIYGMKPLGGGNLLKNYKDCLDFVLDLSCLDAIAVGMQTIEEIDDNVAVFEGKDIDEALLTKIKNKKRRLMIDFWCEACGKCAETCSHRALMMTDEGLVVDHEKCVLCGYCSKSCPHFCIKVI
ncbi:aldo/keto reductase [Clostridium formicaceticum]|uniref:2,5-diketo-D-gluconic acid reductase A n=1 Tax=Clostridium formicaceticum TaxID=1497 RepID=A0AAC9RK08_9CLOT|nr:aldo/keto reductase [Clostridium formicaceticum]AOY77002.1 aldo/keto reductase [Clostridium formicaceticum]ARE87491.1 2,5-diketo-D-gluconic acid reductase A [Clostridium formicaceticum]